MTEQLTSLRRDTRAIVCADCGKCSARCPLAVHGAFSPRSLAAQPIDDPALGRRLGLYRCLTCGSCSTRCPQEVAFVDYVRGMRNLIPRDPVDEPCPHGGVIQAAARAQAREHGPSRDPSWLGDDLEIAEEGEVALFVGCLPTFDAMFSDSYGLDLREIARSAIRVLNHAGIRPVLVAEEVCCGHDLLWSGERGTFDALARANAAAFETRGVRHIVTACAECARTWSLDYREVVPDYKPRVEHLAEFIANRIEEGALTFEENNGERLDVTYHDACRLGRHLGVFDAPRAVLDAIPGATLSEMKHSREDALCCGTSGFQHCDRDSRKMQTERLAEASATGASKLVTTCPKCMIHFSCAQTEDRRAKAAEPRVEVQDLTVLVASRLQGSESESEAKSKSNPEPIPNRPLSKETGVG